MDVMMALGAFRFSMNTAAYQLLQRETTWLWPDQPRFGGEPILQHTGKAPETIQLEGYILPNFRGGTGQIARLRLQADLGLPLPLISGTGNFYGLWVVENIAESQEVFYSDGQPRRQGFGITLKKYAEIKLSIGGFSVSASGLLGAIGV